MMAGTACTRRRLPRPALGAETSPQQALRDDDPLYLVRPLVDLGERSTSSSECIWAESIGFPVHLQCLYPRG